ncbi:unnamed protein product [Prorocentrum cordatum]|uniref:Uncharacterized protein n=1 Tax=Prorocentrum cordatum TaxID=2364126 RepID=A0ABN9THT2_9DINO|nr:unnamed protein product [Polarella glacialis]
MAAPMPPASAMRIFLCTLLAFLCDCQLDDAVGLVQSSLSWHPQEAEQALGPFFAKGEVDEAAATVTGLAWPAHDYAQAGSRMPRPALITMVRRARLGNRLFQWAAMLSIAKEAGARAMAAANGRYRPSAIPQLANLDELVWSSEDFEWLNAQPSKCHMWDFAWPVTLDYGLENLSNWTAMGMPKGEMHIRASQEPRKGMNWARMFADAILTTPTPSPCTVVELDGFWQRSEFFVHHLSWLRPTFWNPKVADTAKQIMDTWLGQTAPAGAVVGIHLRLGARWRTSERAGTWTWITIGTGSWKSSGTAAWIRSRASFSRTTSTWHTTPAWSSSRARIASPCTRARSSAKSITVRLPKGSWTIR